MKEIRNYKNIRRKPYVYGFTVNGFLIFIGIAVCALFAFATGFTINKIIIVAVVISLDYIVCKLIISNPTMLDRLFNEKFPKEITDLTRNKNKKNGK